jgi:hypothetical protein
MTTYTTLETNNDQVTTRTLLHEAIPLTGTIVSGTYADNNIKNYAHGMFQSVYDYPYLSSSANHIFDITAGYSSQSGLSGSSNNQNAKKLNIYSQMAQVLMGYDATGSILRFDQDGDITGGGTKHDDVMFFNFARLLTKDEIKKGTFEMELGVTPTYATDGSVFASRVKITDYSGSNGFLVNSPAGEYGVLYATQSAGTNILAANQRYAVGLVFYQAGVAVISGSVFNDAAKGGILNNSFGHVLFDGPSATTEDFDAVLTGSQISGACDNIRNRLYNVQFNNTIELNSSIYFCRVKNNDYNYSSNPTYLSSSQIRVKEFSTDMPVSYITTVGLYNSSNELLAVAKLSEPLKKTPDTEFTIRVRLDY